MKNAIIAILALLCGFLGWKLYALNHQEQVEKHLDPNNNKDLFTCASYSFANSPFPDVLDSTGKINNEYVLTNSDEFKYNTRTNRRTTDGKLEDTKLLMETEMLKYIYDYATMSNKKYIIFYYLETENYTERKNYFFDRHSSIHAYRETSTWRQSIKDATYLVADLPVSRADFSKATTSKIEVGKLCPPPGGSCK